MKEAVLNGYMREHPFVKRVDLPPAAFRLPSVVSLSSESISWKNVLLSIARFFPILQLGNHRIAL